MSYLTIAVLLAATLAAAPPPVLAQVRDAPAEAAGAGRIAGVVTAASGQPLPGVSVNLSGRTAGNVRGTVTDTLGQFAFDGLAPDDYTLSARRAAFAEVVHGQAQPGSGRPGTPIALAEGQHRIDLELRMPKGGVITGVVVDEFSYPAPRTAVRAFRSVYRDGVPRLVQAGTAESDDRGIYRIFDLQPGDYVVVATPRPPAPERAVLVQRMEAEMVAVERQAEAAMASGADPAAAAERVQAMRGALEARAQQLAQAARESTPSTGRAPIYFPGTPRSSGANVVPLGLSEEKSGIDIGLQVVPLAAVSGTVTGAIAPPRNTRVFLIEDSPVQGLGTKTARIGPDGSFSFDNVPPGEYRLRAQVSIRQSELEPPAAYWASQPLSIAGQSMTGLTLTLLPSMSATGQVAFDGAAERPEPARIRISFLPTALSASEAEMEVGSAAARVGPDSRFTATGLAPGSYRVTASGAGAAWTLHSVLAGGQEVLDRPLEVRAGEDVGGIVVTFADRATSLSGVVQTGSGEAVPGLTVIVFPEDRRYWMPRSRRIDAVRPSSDGRYRITGLPAGDYRLATVIDPEPDRWFDPEFLGQLLSASIPIALGEGEQRTQDVRVGGQ
jgi:hypothetical protein